MVPAPPGEGASGPAASTCLHLRAQEGKPGGTRFSLSPKRKLSTMAEQRRKVSNLHCAGFTLDPGQLSLPRWPHQVVVSRRFLWTHPVLQWVSAFSHEGEQPLSRRVQFKPRQKPLDMEPARSEGCAGQKRGHFLPSRGEPPSGALPQLPGPSQTQTQPTKEVQQPGPQHVPSVPVTVGSRGHPSLCRALQAFSAGGDFHSCDLSAGALSTGL